MHRKTRVERDLHLPQSELDVWLIENKRMSKLVNEGLNKVNIAQFLNHIRDLGPIFRYVIDEVAL